MTCELPATGLDLQMVVGLALFLVGMGTLLLLYLTVRRRGIIVSLALVVLVVGVMAFGSRYAYSQDDCPAGTEAIAPVATTTTTTPVSTAVSTTTTTSPLVTTTSTVPVSTTVTTAVSTTTTTIPATTTTTEAPVPDLTPTITGPATLTPGRRGIYTFTITNVGTGPTTGSMTFSVAVTTGAPVRVITVIPVASTDWAPTLQVGSLTYITKTPSITIAPGASSTGTFAINWLIPIPGSLEIAITLPAGIGGERNSANNTATLPVQIPPES